MPDNFWANAVFSVTPTILIGLIFWFTMRAIFRSDRTERSVYAKIDAEERAKLGLPVANSASPAASTDAIAEPAASSGPAAPSRTVASPATAPVGDTTITFSDSGSATP